MIARIAEGFRRPILCDDVPIDTRIGIGLKALGRGSPGEDLRATLSAAQDSRSARTGWSWFDQKSDEAHRRAFRLLSDLKHALDAEGQLELHYQPKVDARHRRLRQRRGAAALDPPRARPGLARRVRRARREDRARHPDDPLGRSTRRPGRRRSGRARASTCRSRSTSRRRTSRSRTSSSTCSSAAPPAASTAARIELEITEGVSAARGGLILDRLAALRNLGFSIAIDDFGSGYSNMSYLTRLSAHTLKIDQSLVRGVEADTLGGRLVSNIVQMGRDLGYRMVAEGIETEAERALLDRLGLRLRPGLALRPADAGAAPSATGTAGRGRRRRPGSGGGCLTVLLRIY